MTLLMQGISELITLVLNHMFTWKEKRLTLKWQITGFDTTVSLPHFWAVIYPYIPTVLIRTVPVFSLLT